MKFTEAIFEELIDVDKNEIDYDNEGEFEILEALAQLEASSQIQEAVQKYRDENKENDEIQEMTDEEIEDEIEGEINDITLDEINDIITIFGINKNGLLYQALLYWYGSYEEIMANVRSAYDDKKEATIYFVTGCGYDTMSSDLLNCEADGKAKTAFIKLLNEETDIDFNKFKQINYKGR